MDGVTTFISRGANVAFSRGMVVVASAGNSGDSFDPYIASPADGVGVLAVGAVDAFENYVNFSSIGPSYDGRVKPDVMARGASATISTPNGNIQTANGTSFSGPIIAGMAATFWSAAPWLTNVQVVDFIRQSADQYLNPDDLMGYGIPDFQQALDIATLSVAENLASRFILFPNPVSDHVFITFSDAGDAELVLYNTLGQQVSNYKVSQNQSVNMEALESGIYFYKIATSNAGQSGKIIKK